MKLSVIIPNRNDTAMLAVTVRSALEGLKAIDGDGEVVVVDNSDLDLWQILRTPNESPLDLSEVQEGRVQLIRQPYPCLYSARAAGIKFARGEYSYNADSHTLFGHNHFKNLVEFMDSKKDTKIAFGFSPIGWLSWPESFARHDIRLDEGTIFGSWGRQYKEPTRICWNFGSRICRTKWFNEDFGGYGFFARERLSWGGGEFYIPVKALLMGYENWAIPCSPQYHIGPFSAAVQSRAGYKYRNYDVAKSGKTKIGMGILAAFYALGGDDMKAEALKARKGVEQYGLDVERDWAEAKRLAEKDWLWLKERQVMTFQELWEKKPWDAGGWAEWNPDKEIKRIVNLGLLPTTEGGFC